MCLALNEGGMCFPIQHALCARMGAHGSQEGLKDLETIHSLWGHEQCPDSHRQWEDGTGDGKTLRDYGSPARGLGATIK